MEYEILSNKEIRVASDGVTVSAMMEGSKNTVSTVTISTKWDFFEMDIQEIPILVTLLKTFLNEIPSNTGVRAVV